MKFSIEKRNRYLKLMIKYQKELLSQGKECNIIGERVRFFREGKGLKKSSFCEYAQIERTTLYKIESGQITPSFKTLCKIVDALKTPEPYEFILPPKKLADIYDYDEEDDFQDTLEYVYNSIEDNDTCNIYRLKDELLKILQNKTFTYYIHKESDYFPKQYIQLLIKNISASFAILDFVKHDKDQGDDYSIFN